MTNTEITADLKQIQEIIAEMVSALSAHFAPKSRERSLVITKLEEAAMWAEQGLKNE